MDGDYVDDYLVARHQLRECSEWLPADAGKNPGVFCRKKYKSLSMIDQNQRQSKWPAAAFHGEHSRSCSVVTDAVR